MPPSGFELGLVRITQVASTSSLMGSGGRSCLTIKEMRRNAPRFIKSKPGREPLGLKLGQGGNPNSTREKKGLVPLGFCENKPGGKPCPA